MEGSEALLPAVVEGVVGDPVPPSTISHQLDSVEVWTQCFICQKKSQLLSADSEQFYSVEKTRAQVNPAAVGTERLLRDILEDVIADLNPRIRVGSLPWTRDDYVCSKCFRLLTQYLSLSQQLHLVEQALKKEIGSEKLKLWEGGGDMVEADKGILQLEAESESLPRKRWRKRKAGEEPDDHPDQKRLELEDELEMQESSFPSEANSRIVWDLRPEAVRVLEGKDQERKDQIFLEALENEFTQCQFQHTKENLSSSGRRKRSLFSAFSCSVKSCTLQTWIARLPSGKALKIFSLGESRHEKDSDPNRNLFEMSRMEFGESGICEFCCKAIANPGNLDPETLLSRHQSDCPSSPSSSRPYSCPDCQASFKTFQTRNSHYLSLHTSDAPYKCGVCSKAFKLLIKRNEHSKKCAKGAQFPCDLCAKVFVSARNRKDHVNVVHSKLSGLRNYRCTECPKSFYKRANLKSHLLTHSEDKTFRCNFQECGKLFKRDKSLKHHLSTMHSGKKPSFLCVFCGKSFGSFSGMKLHSGKEHTGEEYIKRAVTCNVCQKSFRCQSDLKIHSVVHSKEKPFPCDLCTAAFSQRASLKDHVNVHLKKFQCSMCQKSFGRERYLQTHLKTCGMAAKEIALQQQQQDLSDFEPLSSAVVGDCKEDGLDKGSTMISIIGKEPGPVDPQEDDEKYRQLLAPSELDPDDPSSLVHHQHQVQVAKTISVQIIGGNNAASSDPVGGDNLPGPTSLVQADHSAAEVLAQLTNTGSGTITMLQYPTGSEFGEEPQQ